MVIAVPTGIKIFSWLSYSLSKNYMANTIKYFTTLSLNYLVPIKQRRSHKLDNENKKDFTSKNINNLYKNFPRANRKYIKENNSIKDLVVFGTNLSSTVNYPSYSIIVQHMVKLPSNIINIIVGLLLSDSWMQKQNLGGHARLFLKQSLDRSEYLLFVFIILQHYCKSYPKLGYTKFKGKIFPFLIFSTRSLVCLTEIHDMFYKEGKKVLPYNIMELLTIEGLAH
jgi:heme/copper-type cytochrome/quinol oxidase subunit 1